MPCWLNRANLLVLGWCVYTSQGILFPKGTLFTQLLLIVLLLVSFYHCFIVNTRYKLPPYFWGLNVLLIMFFIYGIYLMIGGYNPADYSKPVDSFNYLKGILISLMPIYSFYVLSKENLLTEKKIQAWVVVFFILAIGNYYQNERELLLKAMMLHSSQEEFTNNSGYLFVTLMAACIFFSNRKIIQYAMLAVCILFIIMAMKRGAILVGCICLLYYLWHSLRSSSFKGKVTVFILAMLLCLFAFYIVQDKMNNSPYFQKRVENTFEGNGSGRDVLYGTFANYFWNDATPLQFIFGSGANATLKISTNYAHNDWLEIAINQGLLGILLYLLYWICFAKTAFNKNLPSDARLCLQLSFISYFLETFFSMSYGSMPVCGTFLLGYSLAQGGRNEQVAYSFQIVERK